MSEQKTTISKGSWVLVTGATGYVASQVIKQFLERGYRVRGTVRESSKVSWIADEVFKSYAEAGNFELASVPNITADGAFDEAVKGVSAIIHVATFSEFNEDPNKVIPPTVAAATSILQSALKEPLVKQFVFTSSAGAAALPTADKCQVERDTWNDTAVKLAWAPPPYGPQQSVFVYFASKVEAEKAVWKVAEEKPHFSINVISPGTVLGEVLHNNYVRSTGAWVPALYKGQTSHFDVPATFVIDAKNIGLVHVAATLDPEVINARLQVWGEHCDRNDILAVLRKLRPQHRFISDFPDAPPLGMSTDQSEALRLLKKWGDQDGWKPLEATIADNIVFESD